MGAHRRKRRTKIVCTLGPASSGPVLEEMLAAGMDVARLNFSHGTHAEHVQRIEQVRRYSAKHQRPVAILQDLSGPKIRIGDLPGGRVELTAGQTFTLTTDTGSLDPARVRVAYPEIIHETPVGAPILLADGQIEMEVQEKTADALTCRVKAGGELRSQAGINFPSHSLSIPVLTAKDKEDLRFGVEVGVDFIALSYVRQAQDVLEARALMASLGANIPLIAKIERHEALNQVEAILEAADGLMVARGDLGVEMPLESVPFIQKRLISLANRVGKPVITATQMLLSMVDHPRPTRAEAADVANAILDGTDAVMLSDETARGRYPVAAVKFLDHISKVAETHFPYARWLRDRTFFKRHEISEAISFAACEMAQDLEAAAILTSTSHGITARLISRFRPHAPVIGITPNPETWRRLALSWGVFSLLTGPLDDTDHMFRTVKEEALKAGWLKPGDRVVITAGTPIGISGATNLLKADTV
jgi:pyruvate kinase